VGAAEEVLDLWRLLAPAWGPAREVRACQPVMVIDGDAAVEPDPLTRPTTVHDLDLLVPACIAMFTSEVGVSPVAGGGGPAYRARIAEIVRDGRSFARIDDGVVVFKAEVGAVAQGVCQVQGVWVDPAFRGRRLSESGMAAVSTMARAGIAPTVSLYVNDYNTAARKAYRAVGFREQGAFATVLF
jgi:predicted GNAT family acetyltransferase